MAIGTTNATAHTSGLSRRQRYEQQRAALESERSSFDAHWRELAEFLAPRRTRYTLSDKNRGEKRSQSIIDSAPRFALRTLQSGMHAGLTSPARPWMKLTTPDPDLADMQDVKDWLHAVTQRMLTLFLKSNLYNALPILYGDIACFGTGAIAVIDDEPDLMRCYSFPVGSFAFGLDARGMPSTFTYQYQLTVRQLVEQFGTSPTQPGTIDWARFSTHVKSLWDAANYTANIDVCWFIGPNDEYDPDRLEARHTMKFRSCHYELARGEGDWRSGDEQTLKEKGFLEFPVMAPRWDVTGEDTYGTDCPGMTVLGDVKQLQLMQKRKAQVIEKFVNPPLVGPANLRAQKVSSLPGDITYVDVREGNQSLRPMHELSLQGLQYLIQDMGETRERVRRGFYEDLFLMLAQSDQVQPVTAAEIHARQEEKLIALGPVLERTNDELLDPLVDRVFAMMLRAGVIPEPPEALQGMPLKVEYLSIMAQAQKLVGVTGQDRLVQSALGMVEAFPEVRHKVDVFQVMDRYGDMLGVDPKIVRSDKDASALMQQEQEAQQRAQQAEQNKTEAQAAQALGNTPMQGDTALNALVSRLGPGGVGGAPGVTGPPV